MQKVILYYDAHAQVEYPRPTKAQKAEMRKQREAFVKKIQKTEDVLVLIEDCAISTEYQLPDGKLDFEDTSDEYNDLTSPMSYEFLFGLTKQLSDKGIGVENRHYILRSAPNFSNLGSSITNAHIKYIIEQSILESYNRCRAAKDSVVSKILNSFLAEVLQSPTFKTINNAPSSEPAVVTFKRLGQHACIDLAPIEDMHLVSHLYDLLYNQNAKLVVVCAGSNHTNVISQVLAYFGFKQQQKHGDISKVKNILDSNCFDLIK